MRQLTSLDAQFLALETPRQSGHVAGLAILDTSTTASGTLSCADIQALIAERLPLVPPFRWRLAEVPFNLDYGYWVDDPDFDLEFHVREIALAPPGTDAQLAEQVARIYARPLDRSRRGTVAPPAHPGPIETTRTLSRPAGEPSRARQPAQKPRP